MTKARPNGWGADLQCLTRYRSLAGHQFIDQFILPSATAISVSRVLRRQAKLSQISFPTARQKLTLLLFVRTDSKPGQHKPLATSIRSGAITDHTPGKFLKKESDLHLASLRSNLLVIDSRPSLFTGVCMGSPNFCWTPILPASSSAIAIRPRRISVRKPSSHCPATQGDACPLVPHCIPLSATSPDPGRERSFHTPLALDSHHR